jgi:glycosyltransferase involved in cell wall biosynthesis
LTYHFPPSGAVAVYRMIALARYLPRFGWQPVIVAPPNMPWEPEDPTLLAQVPPDTPIERVPFPGGFFGKVQRYFAPEAHWLLKARGACKRMIDAHRPAALITSSPPNWAHVLGLRLHRRFGLPWIADFRDPWYTNRTSAEQAKFGRCQRWLERKVMQRANVLVANTPLNQEGWASAFPREAGKMLTITNGFDPESFVVPFEPGPARQHVRFLHAGELYFGRDPRPLLDAIQSLQSGPADSRLPIEVEFVGRTSGSSFDLPTEIRNRGLSDCVQLGGQIPYAEALTRMLRADVLMIFHTPGYRIGVPAKLYEYLGAGRAILALTEPDGDSAWVLRESKVLHRIAPPTDVNRIRQAVVELTHELQAGSPASPDPAALAQFTRERMAQRFAESLDRIVS